MARRTPRNRPMSWPQRIALRELEDGPSRLAEHSDSTVAALVRRGMIATGSRADGAYELTAYGRTTVAAIIRTSGDGPEQLKRMFAWSGR